MLINKHKSEAALKTKIKGLYIIPVLLLIVFTLYSNSLKAPFILDDILKIEENPQIQSLVDLPRKLIYRYTENDKSNFSRNDPSRPVVYITFALNYAASQLNTYGYHIVNVAVHALNVVIVFFMTSKILTNTKGLIYNWGPLMATMLFAVHPANASVVNYTFSRSDSLATLFYLSAILLFMKYCEGIHFQLFVSYLCLIFALFTKQIAITLPAILFLYDFLIISDGKWKEIRKRLFAHLGYWGVGVSYVLFRIIYFGGVGDLEAENTIARYPYILSQAYAIFRYLKYFIWPTGFSIDHGIPSVLSLAEPRFITSFIIIAICITATLLFFRNKRELKFLTLFLWAWFFVTLSPTSSIFPTTSILVENRMYLSGIGITLLFSLIYFFSAEWVDQKYLKNSQSKLLLLPLVVVILALSITTWKRNALFNEPERLWESVVGEYPHHWRGHYNLGLINLKENKLDNAERMFIQAIKLKPDYSMAFSNIGYIKYLIKDNENAKAYFRKAIELNPNDFKSISNLASIYYVEKDFVSAVPLLEKAIQLNQKFTPAYYNLGQIYYSQKQYDLALKNFENVILLNPKDDEAHNSIALIHYQLGDIKRAIEVLEKAKQYSPISVLINQNLQFLKSKSQK